MKKETCIRECADVEWINRQTGQLKQLEAVMERSAQILNLCGNETRLKILYLIFTSPQICVCDISDILNLSISAVSQHLRKLKDGNLVVNQKKGQTILYTIQPDNQQVIQQLLVLFNLIPSALTTIKTDAV